MKTHKLIALALALVLLTTGCGNRGIYRTIGNPLLSEEFSIGYRSGDKLGEYLTAALLVLAADGTLAELSRKWFGKNAVLIKGDASALDALFEEGIPERRLIAGVDAGSAPMCWRDGADSYAGFDVELIKLIVARLGWTVVFSPISEADVKAQLGSGNVDCALGGIDASKGGSHVGSTPAYLASEKVLVSLAGSGGAGSKKALADGVLAMTFEPSSDSALTASEGLRDSLGSIMKLDSAADCLDALRDGSCDAVIIDSLALDYYAVG